MTKIIGLPVLKIGRKNHNLRTYDKEATLKIIDDFNSRKKYDFYFFGELVLDKVIDYNIISIDNISHKTTKLYIKEDILYANIKLINNGNGKVAENMLDSNLLVLRPRLYATTLKDGFIKVDKLISFDLIRKEVDSFKDLI